jgi:hypothetical protein
MVPKPGLKSDDTVMPSRPPQPISGHVFRREGACGPVWYAKYRLPDGRQVQRRVGPAWTTRLRPGEGFTRRTAQAWLDQVLAEARRGELPGVVRTGATFADAVAEYMRWLEQDRARKPTTLRGYESIMRAHLLPAFGERRPSRLRILTCLFGVMKRAKRMWKLPRNPISDVEKPVQSHAAIELDVFSPEEIHALVRAAESEQDAAIFLHRGVHGASPRRARGAAQEDDLVFPGTFGEYLDGSASVPPLQARAQTRRPAAAALPRPAAHVRDTGDLQPGRLDPAAEGVDGPRGHRRDDEVPALRATGRRGRPDRGCVRAALGRRCRRRGTGVMPRISFFYGIVISMYWDERDHPVAHFHAEYAGERASIAVDGRVLGGHLPPRALRMTRRWARLHEHELLANWRRARCGEPLRPIDPLP